MIPGGVNPMLLSAGGSGYQVQRSLRLRASASAYLSKTFTSVGNQTTYTFSVWVKRGALADGFLFSANYNSGAGFTALRFLGDTLLFQSFNGVGTTQELRTNALFRDPTAWTHIVLAVDSTDATASERLKFWVNGVRVSSFLTATYPVLNFVAGMGGNTQHAIGANWGGTSHFDGPIAHPTFVDGYAKIASDFGVFDVSGNWVPKEYVGPYGSNGTAPDFSDPTSLTTLMLDRSGNGNNWTANNISLTAGATYDSMLDVPLGGGGNERGNYATLNPLVKFDTGFLTDGNLKYTPVGGGFATIPSTIPVPTSGKWYLGEFYTQYNTDPNNAMAYLLAPAGSPGVSGAFPVAGSYGFTSAGSAGLVVNGVISVGSLTVLTGTEIVRVAVDVDAGKVWFGRPTLWYDSVGGTTGDPATGANPTFTFAPGNYLFAIETSVTNADRWHFANFGQRPFTYTPPSGFKALHTGNLTNDTVTVSGSFSGNVSTNGPVIWMNGTPETLTINGNAVTWGTHADKLAGGFKLRTSSTSYNSSGTNTWTATVLTPASKSAFRKQLAKTN